MCSPLEQLALNSVKINYYQNIDWLKYSAAKPLQTNNFTAKTGKTVPSKKFYDITRKISAMIVYGEKKIPPIIRRTTVDLKYYRSPLT